MKSKEERAREEAEREYQRKNEEFEEEIEEKEKQVAAIYRQYPDVARVPEVLKHLSEDLRYKGFFGEIARRFEDEQIMKTTETRTAAINRVIQLVEAIGGLRKSQADLRKAFYDAEAEELETDIKYKEMQNGSLEEQVKIKIEIDKLTLLEQKIEIEKNIAKLKKELAEIEKIEKSTSPRERKDTITEAIEQIKNKVISVEEAKTDIREKLLAKGATDGQIEKALDEFDAQMAQNGLTKDGLWQDGTR